jgi:hypothetical protein
MNLISRTLLLLKRRLRASKYGINFSGTFRQKVLDGNSDCFINIFIDDEYGLKVLSAAPKTILNLGANVGLFSVFASDCFADSLIHC